jgi:hypothetical protein
MIALAPRPWANLEAELEGLGYRLAGPTRAMSGVCRRCAGPLVRATYVKAIDPRTTRSFARCLDCRHTQEL